MPTIAKDRNWSIDRRGWLSYRESTFGPRLSIYISPAAAAGSALNIQLVLGNGFDAVFEIAHRDIKLNVEGKTLTSQLTLCKSLSPNKPPSPIEGDGIRIPKLSPGHILPCVNLVFDVPPPLDWTKISLRLERLMKDGSKVSVPEITFYKTKRSAPGSFA